MGCSPEQCLSLLPHKSMPSSSPAKTALITGITGQDSTNLIRFLQNVQA